MELKITGIIQSNFIPWAGYFDFINSCDEFIFLDDTQYTKESWRNRNKVKTSNGAKWINVPVRFSLLQRTSIDQTPINYSLKWQKQHELLLTAHYKNAPYFKALFSEYMSIISKEYSSISELNFHIFEWICSYLYIKTPLTQARKYQAYGTKTDRVIDLLKKSNASVYLSGPAAKDYLEVDKFKEAQIELRYKSYSYPPYPQIHGDFVPGLSILDLLFNVGPEAKNYIKSQAADEIAYSPFVK